MKYKKQITTGVLAFALIVSGTTVFALTPTQGSNSQITDIGNQDGKHSKQGRIFKSKKSHQIVGTILAINGNKFTIEVKNKKINTVDSFEINTIATTKFMKDGKVSTLSDLASGAKVIVSGQVDANAKTVIANKVKIVTNMAKPVKMMKSRL